MFFLKSILNKNPIAIDCSGAAAEIPGATSQNLSNTKSNLNGFTAVKISYNMSFGWSVPWNMTE